MMTKENDVGLIDPNTEVYPEKKPEVISEPYVYGYWQTPGLYLAEKLAGSNLVRFIGEKFQPDYLQAIIVIDDNPEELLDRIFSLEQKLYTKFKGLRFDVRVRVIHSTESIEHIKTSTLPHYDRELLISN